MKLTLLSVLSLIAVCALDRTSIAASIAKQCRQECTARSNLDCGSLKRHKKQKCKAKLLHQCAKAKSTEVCQVSTVTPTTIPGGPTSTTLPPSGACRTYATADTYTSGGTTSVRTCGTFDTSKHQLICDLTQTYESQPGCVHTAATVHHYESTADFVDEASVNPYRRLETGFDVSSSDNTECTGGASSQADSIAYSYDSQRRLSQLRSSTTTYTYTAWDASGRPTMGILDLPYSWSETYSYDDAARTMTKVVAWIWPGVGSGGYSSVVTYDANGNTLKQLTTLDDGTVTTSNWAISATETVCK